MKLQESVIEHRLRCDTKVLENKFGFVLGSSDYKTHFSPSKINGEV